ncbi:unnamed protein product [Effrenium voratum]|uniref:VTT domain-containing protein n=1 Tax=Effrenium voratum TaxID=2562239 RepID=A0AA36I0T6_9DINO|nr:unnamed protein product [Effrenium voratum]
MSGDINSQAFWNEFMRRPDAKAAYQAERRLQEKKRVWLEERRVIEERGEHRRRIADALEEAPAELKKLIAPMFHIRFVEDYLWMIFDECAKKQTHFHDKLRDAATMDQLLRMRENFQAGGEERMVELEKEWHAQCKAMSDAEQRKKEQLPQNIDIHTLKHVLEYAQECKREGNLRFQEGLYEEALHIYSQADDAMKKWKVDKQLKNEAKWLKDYHLACLKNKAQAALKLELFQTALDASEAALAIDEEDHKAWYRKVQAEKGLGKFKEAEESLTKLEDVAQWCADRRRILRDCEAERKRIKVARVKHKQSTQDMLGRAFQAGVFSLDRDRELEEAAKKLEEPIRPQVTDQKRPEARGKIRQNGLVPAWQAQRALLLAEARPLERKIHLTAALAGDLMDELAAAYGQKWFQERVRKCARDSGYERSVFLMRLKDVAFEVQKPVLEKWGFEGNEHGVREMTAAIRAHADKACVVSTSIGLYLRFSHLLTIASLRRNHDSVITLVDQNPIIAPLCYIGVLITVIGITCPGATMLSLLGGVLFKQPYASLYAYCGYIVGATISYFVTTFVLGDYMRKRLAANSQLYQKFEANVRNNAFAYLVAARYTMVFPFFFVNGAAALVGVRCRTFIAATSVSCIPGSAPLT